jgi:hypothetical protein
VLPTIAILERAVVHETDAARRRTALCCLIGGLFVVPAWMQATVVYSHPDDVLVVVATVGMLAAVARRRPAIAGAILAAAVAAKPTALVLVPLLLAFNGRARRDALAFGSLGLLAWLPFVVADPRTLLAAQPQTLVQPGSGLAVLGLAGEATPSALRLLQLVAALGLGWLAVRRGHWAAVPLIGFGVRVAIDPGDWGYYAVTVVVAALAWHVLSDSNWIPWAAMVAWLAVGAPAGLGRHLQPHVPWSAQAVLRLTVPLALVALVLCVEARRRSRSDAVPRLGLPRAEASLAQSTSG